MKAGKYNIDAYYNRDYIQVFEFDIDVSNYEFAGSIDYKGNKVNFTITKLTDTQIQVSLDKSILSQMVPGVYSYDIKMDNGFDLQVIEGSFKVNNTITN
jgi:hypothetical protein